MKTFKKLCLPFARDVSSWALVIPMAPSIAQSPVGTVTGIPLPDANAYGTSLRYDSNGNLYAWDGLSVWKQSGGTGNFSQNRFGDGRQFGRCGTDHFLTGRAKRAVEQRFRRLRFRRQRHLLDHARRREERPRRLRAAAYPMPTMPLPCRQPQLFPDRVTSISSTKAIAATTAVRYRFFDASTGTNQVVIDNNPGATTSMAINPKDNSVYVGIGLWGDVGNIYSFSSQPTQRRLREGAN